MKTKRPWAITALLGAALLGVLLIAMGAGSVYIPPGEVARILTDPSQEGELCHHHQADQAAPGDPCGPGRQLSGYRGGGVPGPV